MLYLKLSGCGVHSIGVLEKKVMGRVTRPEEKRT